MVRQELLDRAPPWKPEKRAFKKELFTWANEVLDEEFDGFIEGHAKNSSEGADALVVAQIVEMAYARRDIETLVTTLAEPLQRQKFFERRFRGQGQPKGGDRERKARLWLANQHVSWLNDAFHEAYEMKQGTLKFAIEVVAERLAEWPYARSELSFEQLNEYRRRGLSGKQP